MKSRHNTQKSHLHKNSRFLMYASFTKHMNGLWFYF
uniref:Uncharacterized protein n=1 Tax=Anopheles quadriannulatus TaxID=34691 RepID=A0A182XS57_ANOQN